MFKQILFPVDFSERCVQVRPLVEAVARQHNAHITLFYIAELPTAAYGVMGEGYPMVFDLEELSKASREQMAAFADVHFSVNAVSKVVEVGDPGSSIVRYAKAAKIDLIMMPTHGYGRFRRFLLGSVTAKVLHDAQCAVWTASHCEDPNLAEHQQWKNILCAVDRSEQSVPLIQHAAELADEMKARLTLVHAVTYLEHQPPSALGEGAAYFVDLAREEIAKLQEKTGASFQICVAPGNASEVVRDSAIRHNADLVLIGRGKMHETLGGLRSNTYAIVRDSPCPVLSI